MQLGESRQWFNILIIWVGTRHSKHTKSHEPNRTKSMPETKQTKATEKRGVWKTLHIAPQRLHWWVGTGSSARSSQMVGVARPLKSADADMMPYLPAKAGQNCQTEGGEEDCVPNVGVARFAWLWEVSLEDSVFVYQISTTRTHHKLCPQSRDSRESREFVVDFFFWGKKVLSNLESRISDSRAKRSSNKKINSKFSTVVRHGGDLGPCSRRFSPSFSFVLTLFIFKAPNYVLARTLTERVV